MNVTNTIFDASFSSGTSSPPQSPHSAQSASSSQNNSLSQNTSFDASIPSDLRDFTIVEPGITIRGDISGIDLYTYSPVLPDISFNLNQEITIVTDSSGEQTLVDQIRMYASQINCTDFHGKGTIDDYAVLFDAASKLVNDTKQVELDVEMEGFNEFAQAADDLSALFASFTKRLQNVNIIDDTAFLTAISNALQRIINLTHEFGKFKETIKATNTIQLSQSVGQTKQILEGVTDEITCAMNYITHFTNPDGTIIPSAELSADDKNAIQRSVQTLNAWSEICNHGVSIAMVNDPDIQYIQQTNQLFLQQSAVLRQSTSTLRGRYAAYF